ncbi:MAG: PHB depolymerase family esterase [Planctomycetota bacterium]|nr:PHB depolymerase family esterase [Planctomycetota bacterium]
MRTFRVIASLIVSVLLAGAARADELEQIMLRRYNEAVAQENWPFAIAAAEKLHELRPKGGVFAFNAACAHARAGDKASSAKWLLVSARNGFAGIASFEDDPDLVSVRSEPGYAEALAIVRKTVEARFAQFKALADAAKPVTVLPPGFDRATPAPLIIALHGSGGRGDETSQRWQGAAANVGAVLIAPDALRPMGGGYQWTFRDEADWYIQKLISDARQQHNIDPQRVVLVGFSQGANISFMMGVKHPGMFRGIVPVCGHWEAGVAPVPEKTSDATRWFVITGANDPAAATNNDFAARAKKAGLPVELRVVPRTGHSYPPDGDATLTEALRAILAR